MAQTDERRAHRRETSSRARERRRGGGPRVPRTTRQRGRARSRASVPQVPRALAHAASHAGKRRSAVPRRRRRHDEGRTHDVARGGRRRGNRRGGSTRTQVRVRVARRAMFASAFETKERAVRAVARRRAVVDRTTRREGNHAAGPRRRRTARTHRVGNQGRVGGRAGGHREWRRHRARGVVGNGAGRARGRSRARGEQTARGVPSRGGRFAQGDGRTRRGVPRPDPRARARPPGDVVRALRSRGRGARGGEGGGSDGGG